MKKIVVVAIALIASPAFAGETIVGRWAPNRAACGSAMGGEIAIDPKMIVADDWRCDFSTVQRSGDIVTWNGTCGFPEPAKRATVVATSSGAALSLRINGGAADRYVRCPRA